AHRVSVVAIEQSGVVFKNPLSITVSGSTGGAPPPGLSNIKHIIFYVNENRSFDNYLGRLGQYRRDRGITAPIDELPLNATEPDKLGRPVKPFHFQTVCHEDTPHEWTPMHIMWDSGVLDKFVKETSANMGSSIDPYGTRVMGYYDWSDLPYYYELAFQFGVSDRHFSSVAAATIPNRMYLFAGTSFGHVHADPPPSGGWTQPTIFDHLDQAGVIWKYYYQDNSVYLAQWSTWQRDQSKVQPIANYFSDLKNNTLPQVVFI